MKTSSIPLRLVAGSPSWPVELSRIEAPPEALWVRGQVELLARTPRVAIVGTRAPTPYGEAQALRFGTALAEAGVCIVSGLARGIDQAAHWSALRAGGATIAVLGSGVSRPWPDGELTQRIALEGLLLSEFQPEEPPRPHHFPMRNRVISGLACAVLVIEAAHASGSLITARWAADQGRGVYALPGRVDHPMSRGVHRLLREGATLVEDPEEILADLGLAPQSMCAGPGPAESHATLDEKDRALLAQLRGETLTADQLADRLRLPLTDALVRLVEAEMRSDVVRTPGGLYRLAQRGA